MNKFAILALGLIAIILIIFLSIIIFGQDSYRYPCQDPENFSTPTCEPPLCENSGTCTKDVIKKIVKKEINEKN